MQKKIELAYDFTKQAKFYKYRPNYAAATIDMLVALVRRDHSQIKVADIGAGTGNLSIMLLERGCRVVAVEPNDAMREIGIERTKGQDIEWVRAIGVDSTLESGAFDWVTFGSSFSVMDRREALEESHRLLKQGSYFSCMWNHRDFNDPFQKTAEDVIAEFIPNYTGGVRREDQKPFLLEQKDLFDNILYIEEDFYFHQSLEDYIKAWRSVQNNFWDLETKEGVELFEKMIAKWESVLPKEMDIKYHTRCWSAKKI
ncbi:class I SAM-dependent methyltransferase [Helicobacter turcicus]|uniref:Class I SAM-dependent methyltransferase n=1 Tax=Helicobacter turcicus TaxID=2867412 RepID=A0ABS7JQ46_9HELI|nr:class I SAM-dependent methyltransferase [Helicobacter turcicus]MBX7491492.1 class I SAM-dependent methyltransferase [Helicobacter turcicus]MBX7546348.1 class I SAM-dependent methyltransferase [Helicobacter turcicus]